MMAVLADGMGGHSGGAVAAEQVVLKARQNFETYSPDSETPRDLLTSIVNEAHVVIRLSRFTTKLEPHSTIVALLLQPGRVDWAHCGDSRLYHFRGSRAMSRSMDHSLVGELQRKGKIDETEALTHPQRNVLLSCLGSEREPQIDFGHADSLKAGDSFLLCSDGLWGDLRDAEIGDVLGRLPPRDAARELVSSARARASGSGDNISLAIIKLVDAALDRQGRSSPTLAASG